MSLKKLIIIIAILIVAVIALGSIALFAVPRERQAAIPLPAVQVALKPLQEPEKVSAIIKEPRQFDNSAFFKADKTEPPSKEARDRAAVQLLARNFVEAYGTFSTNGGYDHIIELYSLMTASMQEFVAKWIADDPAAQRSPTYYAILSAVANVTILSENGDHARILVDTLRTETDVPEYYNRRFKQEAEIDALKIGGEWKINGVFWK